MSVHDKVNKSVETAKTKIKSLIKVVSDTLAGKDDIDEAMAECSLLLKDSRYEIMQKYLSNYKRGLKDELEELSIIKEDTNLEVKIIGAKLSVLRDLLERPERIAEEYKRLNPEENDDSESVGS